MHYYDASAKNDINIDAFMDDLMGQVYQQKFGSGEKPREKTVTLDPNEYENDGGRASDKPKPGCCGK